MGDGRVRRGEHVRLRRPRGEAARLLERLREVVPEAAQQGEPEVYRNRTGRLIVLWGEFSYSPLRDGEIVALPLGSDQALVIDTDGRIAPWVDAEDTLSIN